MTTRKASAMAGSNPDSGYSSIDFAIETGLTPVFTDDTDRVQVQGSLRFDRD
jgi:hypothetical protein